MAKKKNGKSNGHSNGNGGSEFSKRNKSLLGYNAIFTPEVIDDIHIKEAVKLKGGSKEPGRNIVASISKKQLEDIANQKMNDLNAHDLDEAVKIIAGSARSMGIEVKE